MSNPTNQGGKMEPQTGDRVRVTLEGVYDARDYVATFIVKDEATGNTIQLQKSYPKTIDVLERKPVEGQLGMFGGGSVVVYKNGAWAWIEDYKHLAPSNQKGVIPLPLKAVEL